MEQQKIFKDWGSSSIDGEPAVPVKWDTVMDEETFAKKLEEGLSDDKIQYEIVSKIDSYLNYDNFFSSEATRDIYTKIWLNKKFLENFLRLIANDNDQAMLKYVSRYYVTTVNKIAYDYIQSSIRCNEEDREEITVLLRRITTLINYPTILPLTEYMVSPYADFVIMASRSSFNINDSVFRVNQLIVKYPEELTLDNIISLYATLYMSKFSALFSASVFYPERYETEEEQVKFNMISIALLEILDSMSTKDIQTVLRDFLTSYKMFHMNRDLRFDKKSICDKSQRLAKIYEDIAFDVLG